MANNETLRSDNQLPRMKYYLLKPDRLISGPFELETIEAQWEAGRISPDTRATADNGESLSQIRNTPAEDWLPVKSLPGFGQKRPRNLPSREAMLPPPLVTQPPTAGKESGGGYPDIRTVLVWIILSVLLFGGGLLVLGFLLLNLLGSLCRL
jgi:hypothetical protein